MGSTIIPLAALAGPAVHLGIFIRGDWHLHVPHIILAHALVFCGVWLLACVSSGTYLHHFQTTSCIFVTYVAALFASIGTYRAFFHPLRNFPGPRMAALTKFWHVWQLRHGQNHLLLNSLRVRYGDFIRTGPNEITIFHPGAIALFDSAKKKTLRTDWYDALHPRTSTIFTRSEDEHTARRRTWSAAMSNKSIEVYYPRIQRYTRKLMELIDKHDCGPILLNDVMAWFAFDTMGDFLFNEDFGMMDSSTWHEAVLQQKKALKFLAPLNDSTWIIHMALTMLPFVKQVRDWNAMIYFCEAAARKRIANGSAEMDISSWFIDEFDKLAPSRSLKDRERLLSGSIVTAVIAGSDTTRPTLIDIFYFLTRYPRHAAQIYEEVRDVNLHGDSISTLATKTHLNAVIDESMRLLPAAMTGANRLTSDEGLWIEDTFIPPGVKMAAPKYGIMRMEEAFERPDEFIPERWTTRPELVKDGRAFAPFGSGYRQCVGKALALTTLRLVVASVVQRYELSFPADQDVEEMEGDMRDYVVQQPGRCRVLFKERSTTVM